MRLDANLNAWMVQGAYKIAGMLNKKIEGAASLEAAFFLF